MLSITVVVPTLFRRDDLEQCLRSIAATSPGPDKVLVVCRSEDPESMRLAQLHGAEVVITEGPGLAQAIDSGLQRVRTDIVAFLDDDARAHPDWIDRIQAHFLRDPGLGFLAGRDNIQGDLASGSASLRVGVVRSGRIIGNHHLGKGGARPAQHAKGANMAFRMFAVDGVPLGSVVAGTGAQHGNELFLCFWALRRGYHGIYDPNVQVDHFPAPRQHGDDRHEYHPERVRADIRNSVLATRVLVPSRISWVVAARAATVGDRHHPGLLWFIFLLIRRHPRARLFKASLVGVLDGLRVPLPDIAPSSRISSARSQPSSRESGVPDGAAKAGGHE